MSDLLAAPPPAAAVPPADTARRSLAKAISWRVVGTLDTLVLSFLVLTVLGPLLGLHGSHAQNAHTSSLIALTELGTKIVLFYLHERAWARLTWGVAVGRGTGRELHRRTFAKTASWRVLAGLDTILLAFVFTGSLRAALSIGGLEVATKLVLFYAHDRAWGRVYWGLSESRRG